MALSPPSSRGASAVAPLVLAGADAGARVLTATGAANQNADIATFVPSPGAESITTIDDHGNLSIYSGDSYQQATIRLDDNTNGNPGSIVFDTFEGVVLSPEARNKTILNVHPNVGHTGALLRVYATDGTTLVFEIRANGSIHIPTGTSIIADL